ncbi:MAG: hypothetical protein ACRDPQ_03545 [Nocardioidaceae bacterium]
MPDDSDPYEGRYSLALEEARRSLAQQSDELASIRGRAISLASIGSLSAAFVGGLAARDDAPVTGWTGVAIVAYVLLLGVSATILAPWRLFVFAQRANVIDAWASNGHQVSQMERSVAFYMDRQYSRNSKRLDIFAALYLVGLAFLFVEILFLLLDLRG